MAEPETVAVALRRACPELCAEIVRRTDDTLGDLLTYFATRSWLLDGADPDHPDRDRFAAYAEAHGVPPRPGTAALLDDRVSALWRRTAADPGCLDLVLGTDRLALQEHLRSGPRPGV